MAADVSSVVRTLKGHMEEQKQGNSKVLITRDLLGGCWSKLGSEELDLDLHVSHGCQKRLDLKSGKVYVDKCSNSSNSASSSSSWDQNNKKENSRITDLNYPPSSSLNNMQEESCSLELKLLPNSCNYQSVCTLDKVKSALERAGKESEKKRSSQFQASSSIEGGGGGGGETTSLGLFAAGCPGCLLYVLTSRRNPKCPRCGSIVPSPALVKKPRIDLNATL